jgi:MYXO-CTERM domain-containing protein
MCTGSDGQAEPFTADGEKLFVNAINVLAVPEPGAALVGSLGLLVLLRRRRD